MTDTSSHDLHWRYAALAAVTVAAVAVAVAIVADSGDGSGRAAATPASSSASPGTTVTAGANTVSVSGTGSVEGVPDTLDATIGVQARDASVQAALNDSAADARKVLASLAHSGVAAKDVQTSDVELDPDYGDHDAIVGYDSSETLDVRIHPLSSVGRILTAASTAAGNSTSINGLSYDIADDAGLLTAARARAFANARTQAAQYAQLSGRSLGSVASISAVVSGGGTPTYDKSIGDALAASSPAVPIRAGQQQVSVTVKVVWALT
jgi:hypothetical protein